MCLVVVGATRPYGYENEGIIKRNEKWFTETLKEAEQVLETVHQEAIERRDMLLEDEGLFALSKEDFDTYFDLSNEGGTSMFQKNVGDCYLIAALDAMRRCPHFEMMCRSSVTRNPDGSWEIKIPFMGQYSRSIVITSSELKVDESGLLPLEGAEGYQALEAAYMKGRFGTVDREKSSGGKARTALSTFLGAKNITSVTRERKDSEKMSNFLTAFNRHVHIATAITYHELSAQKVNFKTKEVEEGGEVKMVTNHAYSVFDVDKEKEVVYLVNPWDTTKLISVSFYKFKELCGVDVARSNNTNLLQTMEDVKNMA